MSQETARLGVPTKSQFVDLTKATGKWVNPGRGSGMNRIDLALEFWDGICNDVNRSTVVKLTSLSSVINECQAWKRDKAGKNSALCQQRRQVIDRVELAASKAYAYLGNKNKAEINTGPGAGKARRGGVKAMEPGYALERAHYEQLGKQGNPYSASNVVEHLGDGGNIGAFSLNQFTTTASDNALLKVEFMNRAQRMAHLVVVENGQFLKDGQPLDHVNGDALMCDTYVVDRYGNLFSKPFKYSATTYFNHSSYCAGKAILCAGTIGCHNGQLVYISNLSGHYKPNSSSLLQYLHMLQTEGVSLDDVLIDSMDLQKSMQATSFLREAGGPEDWPHWQGNGAQRRPVVLGGKRVNNPA